MKLLHTKTILKWIVRSVWLLVFIGTTAYDCFKPEPHLVPDETVAPNFALKDLSGNMVRLSDYRGRVVVLDFWATWSTPCQDAMPDFGAAADSFRGKPVTFIGINSWDDWDSFKSWVPSNRRYSSVYYVFDPNPEGADVASLSYKVTSIPTDFVIDKRGVIVESFAYGGQGQITDAVNATLSAP